MQVSKPAPLFTTPAAFPGEGPKDALQSVSLNDYRGKWVLLFWYPLDFTFVCPTEILALSDRFDEFDECECAVLGASCDSVYSHRAWMRTPRSENGIEGVRFPLLADKTGQIARDYGIYLEDEGHSLRGLFLIDPEGILVHATINANTVGRNVSEVLRTLQAFQSGGLCASDWKPGDKNL
jgi:alkyl hydroperoxide reductase subunit AhpC